MIVVVRPETPVHGFGKARFITTRWSIVLSCSDSATDQEKAQAALAELCKIYWRPVFAFICRQGNPVPDAQDLTQEFFARFLETNSIGRADPKRGKFRTFLLGALKNFLTDAHRKATAWKRGGGFQIVSFEETDAEERYRFEPVDNRTPDQVFDQRWLVGLLETAMARLRDEFSAAGKERQFQVLKVFLSQEGDDKSYEAAGAELNASAKTIAVAVHRIRRRFRQVVRSAIAETVSSPEDVEEEYRSLFA